MNKKGISMIVYVYSKCSTCRDALKFLKSHHVAITVKEITIETPSLKELHKMLSFKDNHLKKLFNTSGLLYKELQLSQKLDEMPLDASLQLLRDNGMLVKRPFLIGEHLGLTGFNEQEWAQAFS